MPEYFFHIRLDIAGRDRDINKKARIFATPPQLGDTLSQPGSAFNSETEVNQRTVRRVASDWRAGKITIQSIDMVPSQARQDGYIGAHHGPSSSTSTPFSAQTFISKDLTSSPGANATKARFEPGDIHEGDAGWGVIRLFRDVNETPGLDGTHYSNQSNQSTRLHTPLPEPATTPNPLKEEECTTLCILAVPSYFSPTRFLSWVGEKTREEVSHFRMLRTEESNRYMVLMRFRNGKRAREWRKEWNGAYFDDASPEIAQVVFVKSIELMSDEDLKAGASFPVMVDDPLAAGKTSSSRHLSPLSAALSSKPPAPPTPSLLEMPTCPVCLERMDESSGLLTIICQHVFHCSCLYKWRGTGCPVCRFTHSGLSGRGPHTGADEDNISGPNECNICHSDANLWICLICGNIGCGRYDAAHAFLHWQQSGHVFSMDMSTQRIWDYERDAYVHRIVQNKLDGKISEAPEAGSSTDAGGDSYGYGHGHGNGDIDADYVPREKSDAIGREYMALLNSQLESQRAYFEEKVSLSADKASQASTSAIEATQTASKALAELTRLREAHDNLAEHTIPALEKERDRANKRADRSQEMARRFEKEWREEKALGEGLHERIKTLDEQVAQLKLDNERVRGENAEQAEMVRDLQFFISGQQKLQELGEEVVEGAVSLPEGTGGSSGGKGKGKGKRGKGKKKEGGGGGGSGG